jgi:putative DNA primase/helicase
MSAVATTYTIADALRLLHPLDEVFELRIFKGRGAPKASGYFNDADVAAAVVTDKWDGKALIYHTINPVDPELFERSPNQLRRPPSGGCTSDSTDNIARRAWLAVDIDPERAAGISATDAEKREAMRILGEAQQYLVGELGWPAPIVIDSGNGGNLLWRIEEPNDDATRDLIVRLLGELALRFDEPGVAHVDKSIFNASRILKVPGTVACKGPNTAERPHRRSHLLEVPDVAVWLPRSAMEALAGPAEVKAHAATFAGSNGNGLIKTDDDLRAWLVTNGHAIRREKPETDGTTFVLEVCPDTDPGHGVDKAFVRRDVDGTLSAGCKHASCKFKSWHDLREKHEPGYREKQIAFQAAYDAAQAEEAARLARKAAATMPPEADEVADSGSPDDPKEAPESADFGTSDVPNPTIVVPPEPRQIPAGPFRLTELGNAERLAARHHGRVFAVRGIDELRGYDPARGIYSAEHGLLVRYASDTVRSMYSEAHGHDGSDKDRAEIAKHAARSEAKRALDAMLDLAKSLEVLAAESTDFDADPEMLNTLSGVVDLATGKVQRHAPTYRMTKCAGAAYAPGAGTPKWDAFLARIFAGDEALIAFMQRLFGYALTGYTGEQIFAILHGFGANGKSVLVDTWHAAMGDYAGTAAMKTFLPHATEAVRTDLAGFCGRRLISTSESKPGQVIDAATIKVMTSKYVTARFLYQRSEFTYSPQYLVVLDTNYKPLVLCDDYAIKRRVLLVPFDQQIPPAEQDKKLTETLVAEELPGILAWGVAGAVDYLRNGLRIPETVRAATDEYRCEMDALHEFWGQWLVFGEPDTWTTAKALRDALEVWAGENGVDPKDLPKGSEWGRQLHERGARRDKKKVGGKVTSVWYGVQIVGEEAQGELI